MRLVPFVLAASLVQAAVTGCSSPFIAIGADGGSSGSSGSGSSGSAGSGSASSGAASSGSASSGGGGSGGSSGSSGSCPTGSITFEMRVSPNASAAYCVGAPNACSQEFLTIRGPDNKELALGFGYSCAIDCNGVCLPNGCPLFCPAPSPLTTTGVKHVWDGTQWLAGMCGAPQCDAGSACNLACVRRACTPAGQYVATMCAYPNTGAQGPSCAASQTPTCRDFSFDWPPPNGSATVSWTIGDSDAGVAPGDAGPACFTDPVPSSYKGCAVDSDCMVKNHQTDCCGSLHSLGVSKALSGAYDVCESAWDRHFPGCGCAPAPTTTEDGKTVTDPSKVTVHCLASSAAGGKTCQTTVSSGTGVCASTADCPPSDICGFPSTPACTAQGQCFPAPGVTCLAYSPGCACDGTEINVACTGLPGGYETKPLRHTGVCVDGG